MSDNQFTSPVFVKTSGPPPSAPVDGRQWVTFTINVNEGAKTTFRFLCGDSAAVSVTTETGDVLLKAVVDTSIKPAPNLHEEEP